MRPKDQVTWPRYSTTSARTTTCVRRQRRRRARGRSRPTPRARRAPPPARNIQTSPERQRQQHDLARRRRARAATAGCRWKRAAKPSRPPRRRALELAAGAGVGDGQDVLAAHLLAAGVDEEPPLLQQPVARDVAVLGGEQPLAGGVLRLAHRDERRARRPAAARRCARRARRASIRAEERPSTSTADCAAVCRASSAQSPPKARPGPALTTSRCAADAHLEGERRRRARGSRRAARRRRAVHHHHHPAAGEPGEAHRQPRLRLGDQPELGQRLVEPLGAAGAAAVEARQAAVAEPERPERRHRAHDRLQVRRHRVLVGVLEQPRGPDQQDQDLGEVLGRPRRRAALGVDQRRRRAPPSRRAPRRGRGAAARSRSRPARPAPGAAAGPSGGLRPGARRGSAGAPPAPARSGRPPPGRGPRSAAPRAPPSAWRAARRAPASQPGPPPRAEAADPVLHPGLRQRPRRPVAERGEVVEPEAGLPLGLEPRVGQRRRPDRAAADRDLVAERPPAARRPAPARARRRRAAPARAAPPATSGGPPSRARRAQSRLRQARGGRAIRSPQGPQRQSGVRDIVRRGHRKASCLPGSLIACAARRLVTRQCAGLREAGGVEAVHPAALRPVVGPEPQAAGGVDPAGSIPSAAASGGDDPRLGRARRGSAPTCASPSAGSSEQTQ